MVFLSPCRCSLPLPICLQQIHIGEEEIKICKFGANIYPSWFICLLVSNQSQPCFWTKAENWSSSFVWFASQEPKLNAETFWTKRFHLSYQFRKRRPNLPRWLHVGVSQQRDTNRSPRLKSLVNDHNHSIWRTNKISPTNNVSCAASCLTKVKPKRI